MSRGWKIAAAVAVALAALLVVNAAVVNTETGDAETTLPGAEIVSLPGGDVQVSSEGPTAVPEPRAGRPIVLIHCYSCSLHWWERLAPLLAERHRVIRIDLLGHGGSEKPSSGYSIPELAELTAGALSRLDVEAATVVGHSMGFAVAVALAEQASQLVDRLVNLGEGPTSDACPLPFAARLAYLPVLGPALWRVTPDFAIESGYSSLFAPDFEAESGFEDPDRIVTDYRAMTFSSFEQAREANVDYTDEAPLDERVEAAAIPLLSVFGAEDQVCDPAGSQGAYAEVPGARVETLEGAGHSPNVELPEETAALIEEFAALGEVPLPGRRR